MSCSATFHLFHIDSFKPQLFIEIQSSYCSGEQGPDLRTKKLFTVSVSVPFRQTDGLIETSAIGDNH